MSATNSKRNLHILKLHSKEIPGYHSFVPPGSSITFTVPYGAYGSGIASQNAKGIPSIYHNNQSDNNALVRAVSKKRPLHEVHTLIKRNAGVPLYVYKPGNKIPATYVYNNNNHRLSFHGIAPIQLKTTRSGVVYNRGKVPKNPVPLAYLVAKQPGNYIVHACRFVPNNQRARCEKQREHLQEELAREYKNRRSTLRGQQNRQGFYGESVPLKIQPARKSMRKK